MDYITSVITQLNNAHNGDPGSNINSKAAFTASALNALDVYYKLRIIYLCNEKEDCQVVSLTATQDGIKLINYGTHILSDHTLPSCIVLPRTMFSSYDLTLSSGAADVQVLINFTTLMDFLDCTLCDISEDTILPLNFVLDKWLYISLQRAPTIQELGSVINTSLSAPTSERFCFLPGDQFSAIADTQIVPTSGDDVIPTPASVITTTQNTNNEKSSELRDNIILMLHPLSFTKCDESLVPARQYMPSSSAAAMTSSPLVARSASLSRKVPASPEYDSSEEKQPKKRLKTTAAQVAYMEEWFKKDPLPSRTQREKMVQHLGGVVSLRQVEVWFQNRRAKHKKMAASSSTSTTPTTSSPPASVPSTPTTSVPTTPPQHTPPTSVPSSPVGKLSPPEVLNAGTSSL